jgi:uncharacterized membrane protein (DUF4010 family)
VNEALPIFEALGISLLLGLLVGLQREYADAPLGGIRTFPLVTLLGSVAALLAEHYGEWILATGLLAVLGGVVVRSLAPDPESPERSGLTTMIALLVMYAVGAYVVAGHRSVAVAVGGTVAILLQFKPELHGFVDRLGEKDLKAIMQFVLITFIILPVLPNQTMGPLDVLNPHRIWLMIVLVVGISLGGYLVYRFLGGGAGVLLGGVLGGLISSTATTVSFARRSVAADSAAPAAGLVILIATIVSQTRVLAEIAVVSPGFLLEAAAPLAALLAWSITVAVLVWLRHRGETAELPPQENPTELKSALVFGAIFSIVLLAVAATREYGGERGLYAVAVLSGLTDMDAITLSTAQLVAEERLTGDSGWRAIVIATLANLVFKGGVVAALGSRGLLRQVAAMFSLLIAAGVLLVLFWPSGGPGR